MGQILPYSYSIETALLENKQALCCGAWPALISALQLVILFFSKMLSRCFFMYFHHPHNHKTTMKFSKIVPSVHQTPLIQIAKLLYRIATPYFKSKLKIIISFHFTAGKPKSPQRELVSINIHVYKCQLKLGLKEHNELRNSSAKRHPFSLAHRAGLLALGPGAPLWTSALEHTGCSLNISIVFNY